MYLAVLLARISMSAGTKSGACFITTSSTDWANSGCCRPNIFKGKSEGYSTKLSDSGIGHEVSRIYVVDDCCPERSGDYVEENCKDKRVTVIRNSSNTMGLEGQ